MELLEKKKLRKMKRMARKKKNATRKMRQILGDGQERILTIQDGQVIGKRIVRRKIKTKMNIFDPLMKVKDIV